jgi:MFS family permease
VSAETARDRPPPVAFTHRETIIILVGLMLGMFLAALNQTIVATALPRIAADLHGADHLSWVVSAYVLVATAVTPIYGKLSDLYGRKRLCHIKQVEAVLGRDPADLSHWNFVTWLSPERQ